MLPLAGISAAADTRLPQTPPRHHRRRGHHRPKTSLLCIGVLFKTLRVRERLSLRRLRSCRECVRASVRACAHSLIVSRTFAGQNPTTGGGKRVFARTVLITASVLITPLSTFRLFNSARSCPFGRLRTRVSANRRRRRHRRRRILRFWPFVSAYDSRGYF